MTDYSRLAGLAAGGIGMICLVLPFTAGITPLAGLRLAFDLGGDRLTLFSVTAPAFLAVPIAAWEIRRIYVPVPSQLEIALAYTFAIACLFLVVPASAFALAEGSEDDILRRLSALALCWCAVIANLGLLLLNRARAVPRGTCAGIFLSLAYLPNAFYCLTIFAYWEFALGPTRMWDIGAWMMILTCLLLMARVIIPLRKFRVLHAGEANC